MDRLLNQVGGDEREVAYVSKCLISEMEYENEPAHLKPMELIVKMAMENGPFRSNLQELTSLEESDTLGTKVGVMIENTSGILSGITDAERICSFRKNSCKP